MQSTLTPIVTDTLNAYGLNFRIFECDPDLADTAAFCQEYGFSLEQSANTIIVTSRKIEPVQYAACIVLATCKLDVNKKVCEIMQIKRASFADGATTAAITGMMIGGVTAIGLTDLPMYVDQRVMDQTEIVMGGSNRSTKVILHPHELTKLPNVQVVENLAQLKQQ